MVEYYAEVADAWGKERDIDIKWIGTPHGTTMHDKITVTLASESSEIDIVHSWQAWTAEWAAAGWLEDLTDKITPEFKDSITDLSKTACLWQDRWYALPHLGSVYMCWYNTEHFEEAGINPQGVTNWEEWLDTIENLKIGDRWGMVSSGGDYLPLLFIIHVKAMNGELLDEEGRFAANNDAGLETLQFIYDFFHNPGLDPGSRTYITGDRDKVFLAGKASMLWCAFPNTYVDAQNPERSQVIGEVQPLLVPGAEHLGGIRSSSVAGCESYGISKFSKKKDIALELLLDFNREEIQKEQFRVSGWLPSLEILFEDTDWCKDFYPVLPAVYEQMKYPMERWADQYYQQIINTTVPMFELFLDDKLSAADLLDTMETQINKIRGVA